jgi:hypothetical protein
MELDEAIAVTIDVLLRGGASYYGYDLYPPHVARVYLEWQQTIPHHLREPILRKMTPTFMDAAWELCRRGLVRPGVKNVGEQAVAETGYSVTEAGRAALDTMDPADLVVLQPGSLARTLAGRHKFTARLPEPVGGLKSKA